MGPRRGGAVIGVRLNYSKITPIPLKLPLKPRPERDGGGEGGEGFGSVGGWGGGEVASPN